MISVSGHGEVDSDFSDENSSSGYVGEMYLSVWNDAGENITIFQDVSLNCSQVEIEAPQSAMAVNQSGHPITGLAYDIMSTTPETILTKMTMTISVSSLDFTCKPSLLSRGGLACHTASLFALKYQLYAKREIQL